MIIFEAGILGLTPQAMYLSPLRGSRHLSPKKLLHGCHCSHCLVVRLRSVAPIMISGTGPSEWGWEVCGASRLWMLALLRPEHSWQNPKREEGSWERTMPFSW